MKAVRVDFTGIENSGLEGNKAGMMETGWLILFKGYNWMGGITSNVLEHSNMAIDFKII